MKNIKTYLSLAVTIVFCASINTFAMEKERSDASGEWFDYQLGESNTSSEADNDRNILQDQLGDLKNILGRSHSRAENENTTNKEFNEIKELLKSGEKTWNKIVEMISGHRPINTTLIDQEISLIKSWQENIQEMNNLLLTEQINQLQNIFNTIRSILKKDISDDDESDQLRALLNRIKATIATAKAMLSSTMPVNTIFIEQQSNAIIARLHEILRY